MRTALFLSLITLMCHVTSVAFERNLGPACVPVAAGVGARVTGAGEFSAEPPLDADVIAVMALEEMKSVSSHPAVSASRSTSEQEHLFSLEIPRMELALAAGVPVECVFSIDLVKGDSMGFIDTDGKTVLQFALEMKAPIEVIQWLLDHKADPNRGTTGRKPLYISVVKHDSAVSALLVRHGAKVFSDGAELEQQAALEVAIEQGRASHVGAIMRNFDPAQMPQMVNVSLVGRALSRVLRYHGEGMSRVNPPMEVGGYDETVRYLLNIMPENAFTPYFPKQGYSSTCLTMASLSKDTPALQMLISDFRMKQRSPGCFTWIDATARIPQH